MPARFDDTRFDGKSVSCRTNIPDGTGLSRSAKFLFIDFIILQTILHRL